MGINRRTMLMGLGGALASAAVPTAVSAREEVVLRAVREIVEAIERSRSRLSPDKTLFVPIAEQHDSAGSKLVMQAVLQELKDRGHRIAFGVEEQYDILTDLDGSSKTPLPPLVYRLADPDGQQALSLLNHTPRVYDYADQSLKSLFNFCEQEKISTAFNDLSRLNIDGNFVVDPFDDFASELKESLPVDIKGLIDVGDVEAMALRNAAITINAMGHAVDAGAEIYIQHCGIGHLFLQPFDRSLADLFASLGNGSLPIDLVGLSHRAPEAGRLLGQGKALSLSYLPPDGYDYVGLHGRTDAIAALQTRERAYLENAVSNSKYKVYGNGPDGPGKAPGTAPQPPH